MSAPAGSTATNPAARCRMTRGTIQRLFPEPRRERQRLSAPGTAAHGCRKPGQLAAGAVRRLRRAGANTAQSICSGLCADGLAASVRHRRAVAFEWVGVGQPRGANTGFRMDVTYDLTSRQEAPDQHRACIVPKILRLIGPRGDEGTEIRSRRRQILVEVERRKAVRRIPAPAVTLRETGIERIGPGRIGDPPPLVGVRHRLPPQLHGQACARSNRNMSRHAASSACVSRCASRPISETPRSTGIGRRTTAGIRSRLR